MNTATYKMFQSVDWMIYPLYQYVLLKLDTAFLYKYVFGYVKSEQLPSVAKMLKLQD